MGKNKGGGNRKQTIQPSFFQQQTQKLGPGFMNKINTEFVRKNALKIFRDLACGAINPEQDYEYFNIYDFTYSLYDSAMDNATYNWYCYYGLYNNPMSQSDPNMQRIAAEHYERYTLYNSIAIHLNNILQNITMFGGVYTRFYMQQLIAEIRWKRNTFNGYFITLTKEYDNSYIKNKRRELPNDQGFSDKSEGGFWDKPFKDNM